jgi:signal transduction histidine kinase
MKHAMNAMDADFIDTVVSALRQPLTTISATAQRAKKIVTTDPDQASRALDDVVAQIGRMNMLIGELRDRARDAAHAEALFK